MFAVEYRSRSINSVVEFQTIIQSHPVGLQQLDTLSVMHL